MLYTYSTVCARHVRCIDSVLTASPAYPPQRYHCALCFRRYAHTVILRILYTYDPLRTYRIGKRALDRNESLHEALLRLDAVAEADVNEELSFFSYEHFYVIFMRFQAWMKA